MSQLQDFRFDRSPYARPNQPWVCGRAAQGHECPVGPDRRGRCTQSVPCQPRRSLAAGRRVLVRLSGALVLGLLLVLAGRPSVRAKFLSPGPLSPGHHTLEERCEACHAAATAGLLDLARAAIAPEASARQSGLCLACHAGGPFALAPHGLAPAELASRHAPASQPTSRAPLAVEVTARSLGAAPVTCAACHREHRGRDELVAVADAVCQVCHASRFASFGSGHPDLATLPRRPPTIAFDHAAHLRDYFQRPERRERAPRDCAACHTPGERETVMTGPSFERGCASCHEKALEEEVALLGFPAAHVQKLPGLGVWPADSSAEEQNGLATPFVRALLANDPGLVSLAPELVPPALDIRVLDDAGERERAAAAAYVLAVKKLVLELAGAGQSGEARASAKARLGRVAGGALADARADAFLEQLSSDAISAVASTWLPGAPDDGAASRVPPLERRLATSSWIRGGTWRAEERDLTLRYTPRGHADPLLRTWLELASSSSSAAGRERILAAEERRCTKCHVALPGPASREPRWRDPGDASSPGGLTRFSHRPHLLLADEGSCAACHVLDRGPGPRPPGESGLAAIDRASCVVCHAPDRASTSCTLCHRYHGG